MDNRTTNFHVLLDDPLVVVISSGIDLIPGIRVALRHSEGRRCQEVVQPAWHFPSQLEAIKSVVRSVRSARPRLFITFLCPTLEDAQILRENGLDALHVHTNAFIDHRIFRPLPGRKRLAAVHVASVEPFKRHALAWGVENIGVITYDAMHTGDFSELLGYRRLGFANFRIEGGRCTLGRRLPPEQVARVVAAASCGLILSAKEGQNNASTEYLLCGIPVSSTPSLGGRDVFFDPAHTRIVEPDPRSVEAAVAHFSSVSIDPFEIREAVMRKVRAHRRRFLGWLSAIGDRDLLDEADADAWHPRFTNKLKQRVEV